MDKSNEKILRTDRNIVPLSVHPKRNIGSKNIIHTVQLVSK
ncbi:MAG: hypothetical protein ACK46B_04155 [Bacteroidota bacterium]